MAVPPVHQTDILHPCGDPDDPRDLATASALAARGAFDLRGILLDYPPPQRAAAEPSPPLARTGSRQDGAGKQLQHILRRRTDPPTHDPWRLVDVQPP